MTNLEAVIFECLNTNTGIHAAIGNNLYKDITNPTYNGKNTKGIRFHIKGGNSHLHYPVHNVNVDLFCYGGSEVFSDSYNLYRTVFDSLHGLNNLSLTNGFIIHVENTVNGQNIIENDTLWKNTFSSWLFEIR